MNEKHYCSFCGHLVEKHDYDGCRVGWQFPPDKFKRGCGCENTRSAMEVEIYKEEHDGLVNKVEIAEKALYMIANWDTERMVGANDTLAWANAYHILKRKAKEALENMGMTNE